MDIKTNERVSALGTEDGMEEAGKVVQRIVGMAKEVEAEHAELQSAIRTERAEKSALLARVVEAVRPALKAVCSRIVVALRIEPEMDGPVEREASLKGLLVAISGPVDFKTGRPVKVPDKIFRGAALFLDEEGDFLALEYHGQERSEDDWAWTSKAAVADAATAVANRWPVGQIVARIADALQAQLNGGSQKRTAAIEENVAKLRAVSVLVGEIDRSWR